MPLPKRRGIRTMGKGPAKGQKIPKGNQPKGFFPANAKRKKKR